MKHTYKILLTGFAILIGLVVLRIQDPFFIETARLKGLDYYQRQQSKVKSSNIVVVTIDEATLDKFGQWPMSRATLSEGLEKAFNSGAQLVVMPILFSEKDRLGGDNIFNSTLQKYPVITAQSASQKGKGQPVPRGLATIGDGLGDWLYTYPAAIGPTKEIGQSSAGVGMLLTTPELDAVTRRLPLVIKVKGEVYPTIPLEALRLFGGEESYQAKVDQGGVQAIRVKGTPPILTDANGRVWINFKYSFNSVSYADKDWSICKDKIVFVALTAEGLNNTVATPVGIQQGYEVSAQTLQMLIDNSRLQRPATFDLYEIIFGVILAIALIVIACYFSYILNGIAILVFLCAPYFIGLNLFIKYGYLADYTWPTLAVLLPWVGALFFRFVMEFKLKQQIKKQFGSYVNPTVVERLQKDPSLIKLGGERKELSIVMTDLRGFTTLGESFGDDVESLTQIMNDYMTALSIPVLKNDGTLIKFIGDASLHVHGAPLDDPDHAVTAVLTAQQMIKAIEEFNKELTAKGRPPVGMGAGVNTGETLIGNIGAKSKFGYDVLGDSVSTAARLEGQTKSYGVLCIIGPKTNELVKDRIFTLELDNIAVKGKTVGLRIYAPLFVSDPGSAAEYIAAREVHDAMLAAYRGQRFDQAIKMCQELMGEFDEQMDHSYELWIERCEYMKSMKLPKDWDGIYRATSK